ncbi:hypothetical protein ACLX1H_005951 [Fusarium chlamydosporum]
MFSLLYKTTTCIAFLLFLTWYGQTHFYRDPGSVFFDKARAYQTTYSTIRRAEAEQTIGSLSTGRSPETSDVPSRNKTLCVALNSVARQTQYLPITVGSILNGLSKQEREDLELSVLIAETDATRHPNWGDKWLQGAVDDVYTYDDNSTTVAYLSELEKKQNFREKGVVDYTLGLERCYNTGALYVGVFEDDILLARGWFMRTLKGLADIANKDREQHWLFMRLFNQERSIGWASHEIGGNNEFWIILGIGLGIESARKTTKDEAQSIWSMAFEDLDPESLKKDHQEMTNEYESLRKKIDMA